MLRYLLGNRWIIFCLLDHHEYVCSISSFVSCPFRIRNRHLQHAKTLKSNNTSNPRCSFWGISFQRNSSRRVCRNFRTKTVIVKNTVTFGKYRRNCLPIYMVLLVAFKEQKAKFIDMCLSSIRNSRRVRKHFLDKVTSSLLARRIE